MPSLSKSELYDTLYQMGQDLLDQYQPCNIKSVGTTVLCTDRRSNPGNYETRGNALCCGGCKHLGPMGCTVKALACKLWLCYGIKRSNPELAEKMEKLQHAALAAKLPYFVRASKEECFSERGRSAYEAYYSQ